jgi:hypothetical protein
MQITLVGNRRGRRVILWGQVLKAMLLLIPFPAVVLPLVYYAVRKDWSLNVLFLGVGVGLLTTLIILVVALCTPIYRLPTVPDKQ